MTHWFVCMSITLTRQLGFETRQIRHLTGLSRHALAINAFAHGQTFDHCFESTTLFI